MVTINLRGVEFHCDAQFLIKNNTYFKEELSKLYVGTIFYINRSPKEFNHVLNRIYNSSYIFPDKYISAVCFEFYDLEYTKYNEDCDYKIKLIIGGVKFRVDTAYL